MLRRNRADLRSITSDSPAQNISETQLIIGIKSPIALEPVTQIEQPLQIPSRPGRSVSNNPSLVQCSSKPTSIPGNTTPRRSSRTFRLPERFNNFEMKF